MVEVSKTDVYTIGKIVLDYFKKHKTYPKSVKVKGVDYTIQQSTLLMSLVVATNKGTVSVIRVGGASSPNGDRCNREVNKTTYQDMCKRLNQYITQNGKLPNYVTIDGKQKCSIILFMLQLSKIVSYMKDNGTYPSKILINSNDLVKPQPKPAPIQDSVYEYFTAVFGKVTTIDGALSKVQGNGYGYYYDDRYTNRQSIDRMHNGQGVNCTDSCHVFYHIGKALGYQVRAIHVLCSGGDGHIRLQFNKGDGWFNRDPAAVLNGNDVTNIWCSNATYLATDPDWFLENLNR